MQALGRRERERADQLAQGAAMSARGMISATLVEAGRLAVEAVRADQGRGEIAEAAYDLRELRTDPTLLRARARDLMAAERHAALAILDAIAAGFSMDARERAALTETDQLAIAVTITAADLAHLKDYPIQGRTPLELAKRLRQMLGDAIDETLARPLTGAIAPAAIPPALGEAGRLHGERVGNAVAEAFFAGVQAATRALGRALVGG